MADAFLAEPLGEQRLAIMDNGRLRAMQLWRDGDPLAAGSVVDARLKRKLGTRGIAESAGEELLVDPWPPGLTEGATVPLLITRAAWLEPGRDRIGKARPAGRAESLPFTPKRAIAAYGAQLRQDWPDDVAAQWDDAWEAASLGRLAIAGGSLCLQPTAAFLAVDVDGAAPDVVEAAKALAHAIRLFGLGGNIVMDLPAASKVERLAVGAAIVEAMAGLTYDKTAMNGYGLLQILVPRRHPSIVERAQLHRAASAAVALLAAAGHDTRTGPIRLRAAPGVIRWLESRPHLLAALARKIGRSVDLRADSMAGTGHVEPVT